MVPSSINTFDVSNNLFNLSNVASLRSCFKFSKNNKTSSFLWIVKIESILKLYSLQSPSIIVLDTYSKKLFLQHSSVMVALTIL